jgi:hypothetical protein
MRWESLFDDLEGQLEQELTAEGDDLKAEEERLRLGRLTLRDRIVASVGPGPPLRLRLVSGQLLNVRASAVGRDWLSGQADVGGVIVPLAAIAAVIMPAADIRRSLEPTAEPERGLTARLGFPFVLRDLARRRVAVTVQLGAGASTGTIDRVGRDHLDLAVHERDQPRRAVDVHVVEVIALHAVHAVHAH